jgi:hypothetical protein
MATEGTKYQINYKLNDGTLINLYAKDVKDLETGLADLGMVATLIKSTSNDLHGGAQAPTVASVAESFNATPVAAPAQQQVVEGQAMSARCDLMESLLNLYVLRALIKLSVLSGESTKNATAYGVG